MADQGRRVIMRRPLQQQGYVVKINLISKIQNN